MLSLLGISHSGTSLESRERLAVRPEHLAEALSRLVPASSAREGVLLSTCNRVELYLEGQADLEAARREICSLKQVPFGHHDSRAYVRRDDDVAHHLFSVAAGLDSLVIGETQIIGQVKEAYHIAHDAGWTGRALNPLFQRALFVAKRVHTETAIAHGAGSVPAAAARLAEDEFPDLPKRRLLILGAGETAFLAARAFRHRKLNDITVLSRTPDHAAKLATHFGGLDELELRAAEADIIVSCLSVDQPILRHAGAATLVIDLGVPRNVDPEIRGVRLVNVDDLEAVVRRNLLGMERELERARAIVSEEVRTYAESRTGPRGPVVRTR